MAETAAEFAARIHRDERRRAYAIGFAGKVLELFDLSKASAGYLWDFTYDDGWRVVTVLWREEAEQASAILGGQSPLLAEEKLGTPADPSSRTAQEGAGA